MHPRKMRGFPEKAESSGKALGISDTNADKRCFTLGYSTNTALYQQLNS